MWIHNKGHIHLKICMKMSFRIRVDRNIKNILSFKVWRGLGRRSMRVLRKEMMKEGEIFQGEKRRPLQLHTDICTSVWDGPSKVDKLLAHLQLAGGLHCKWGPKNSDIESPKKPT